MKTLVVVAGPTAVGKTPFAISLAKKFDTEILSADSRQVYKELQIGVAKPTAEQLADVKHHFINHVSITEEYNAGRYETEALQVLDHLFQEKEIVIVCGGSGLYIDALCRGFDILPQADIHTRNQLKELYEQEGIMALQNLLKEKDLQYYNTADLNNPQRLIRALEVCIVTGKPYSAFRKNQHTARPFNIIYLGLFLDRHILYQKINDRVDIMVQRGLEDEARSLYPFRKLNALQTVGYQEWFEYIEGKISREETIEKIKQNTRHFAKRQMTWFRKYKEMIWLPANSIDKAISLISSMVDK